MGRLKIAFVLDDTLDTPDGVQQYVLTIGTWLQKQGHDVHYIVGQTSRTDIANVHSIGKNWRVRFNGNRMSTPLPTSKRTIKKLLYDEAFDIIHVQMPYSPFMAGRIIKLAPTGTAVVGTFHIAPQSQMVSLANKLLGILLKRSLRRFDAIYSVSQAAADFARSAYGIASDIVPNVVDVAHFSTDQPPQRRSDNIVRLVFLGRLVPRKGCMLLLQALKGLSERADIPNLQLTICGRGPLESELKTYVRSHNLADYVTFTGFVTEEEKISYLQQADLAIFPSTGGESFGIVLLEAMAAGTPVVLGADNAGYRTVLAPYPDLLFPVNNVQALADKIIRYSTDVSAAEAARTWQASYIHGFDVAFVGRRLVVRYGQALRARRSLS